MRSSNIAELAALWEESLQALVAESDYRGKPRQAACEAGCAVCFVDGDTRFGALKSSSRGGFSRTLWGLVHNVRHVRPVGRVRI